MDALRAIGRADGAIGRRKAPIGRLVEAITTNKFFQRSSWR